LIRQIQLLQSPVMNLLTTFHNYRLKYKARAARFLCYSSDSCQFWNMDDISVTNSSNVWWNYNKHYSNLYSNPTWFVPIDSVLFVFLIICSLRSCSQPWTPLRHLSFTKSDQVSFWLAKNTTIHSLIGRRVVAVAVNRKKTWRLPLEAWLDPPA